MNLGIMFQSVAALQPSSHPRAEKQHTQDYAQDYSAADVFADF
jgi:hypothetical protein